MDTDSVGELPPGMMGLVKAAARQYVRALGSVDAVAAVIGKSGSFVTRCQRDGYAERLSLEDALLLESHCQVPALAGLAAGLTGHRLVALADDGAAAPADHIADLVAVAGAAAKVTTAYGEGLDRTGPGGRALTPAEAKVVLDAIGEMKSEIVDAERHLARTIEGGGQSEERRSSNERVADLAARGAARASGRR